MTEDTTDGVDTFATEGDGVPLDEASARAAQRILLEELKIAAWIATDGEQWAVLVPNIGDEEHDEWLWYEHVIESYIGDYRDIARMEAI